jgi:hypothetical protein
MVDMKVKFIIFLDGLSLFKAIGLERDSYIQDRPRSKAYSLFQYLN